MIRDHNEDAAYADPEGDFFIVADGMGGHAAGEVASKMAVDAVTAALQSAREEIAQFARSPSDPGRRALVSALENAVRQAHQSVYQRGAAETDKQGMGTTLDVVLIAGSEAFVAHVGDSRTYLVRDKRAAQITTDHTVAEVLVIEGKLSIEEAQISPLRTILVNAIGVAPDVGVEMAHVRLRTGDRLLVCSDGLHDYFPLEQEVSDYVSENKPDEALNKMITAAKNRGGHDNITGIVLEVLEALEAATAADDDVEAPLRVGYEDTGNIPVISDVDTDTVPEDISRDDTAPMADKSRSGDRAAAPSGNGTQSADKERTSGAPKQPPKQAEKQAPKQAEKQAPKQAEKQAPKQAEKQAPKQAEKQAEKQAPKQAEKQAEKQAPKQAEKSDDASDAASGSNERNEDPGEGKEQDVGNDERDESGAPAGGKKTGRRAESSKSERKPRGGNRDRKETDNTDTDELPTEPDDETARRSRSD